MADELATKALRGRTSFDEYESNYAKSALELASLLDIALDEANFYNTQEKTTPEGTKRLEDLMTEVCGKHREAAKYATTLAHSVAQGDARRKDYEDAQARINAQRDEARAALWPIIVKGKEAGAPQPTAPVQQAGAATMAPPSETPTLRPEPLKMTANPAMLKEWLTKFRAYYDAANLSQVSVRQQQQHFLRLLDDNLSMRVRAGLSEGVTSVFTGQDPNVASCVSLLQDDFRTRFPVHARRLELIRNKQPQGQSHYEWALQLHAQAEECDLATLTAQGLITMMATVHCTDNELRNKLIKLKEPNWQDLIRTSREHEMAEANAQAAAGGNARAAQSSAEKRHRAGGRNDNKTRTTGGQFSEEFEKMKKEGLCITCGQKVDHGRDKCPAIGKTCHHCGKKNHMTEACVRRRASKAAAAAAPIEGENNSAHCGCVKMTEVRASAPTPRMLTSIHYRGVSFEFLALPDTGCTQSIIAEDVATRNGITPDTGPKIHLYNVNGERFDEAPTATVTMAVGDRRVKTKALISKAITNDVIIGWQELRALEVVAENFPKTVQRAAARAATHEEFDSTTEGWLRDYPDVFNDEELRPMAGPRMEINLKQGATPIQISTARPTPAHYAEAAEKEIDAMLNKGIITRHEGPAQWCAPGFFVPKEDGRLRFVTDYTGINKWIQRPVHPFPCTADILRQISPRSKYFAKLDAKSGYHQIELTDKASHLTTFILPSGRYRYLRAPMGLSASSDEFCRRSDTVIEGLKWVSKLVDDILVEAPNMEMLDNRVRSVLERCWQFQMTLSRNKAECGDAVSFAGHTTAADGISPHKEKLEAIAQYPTPEDAGDVRTFLGMTGQLASFIPDHAHISRKLRELTGNGVQFRWLPEHEAAFK